MVKPQPTNAGQDLSANIIGDIRLQSKIKDVNWTQSDTTNKMSRMQLKITCHTKSQENHIWEKKLSTDANTF